jgi:hypothetical protein
MSALVRQAGKETLSICIYTHTYILCMPVPVAARSKAWFCGCSPAEIVVSNPTGAWMFVCCDSCVLWGRGLCDELITRPEESYRMWCVVVCDLETLRMRRPWPALGRSAKAKKITFQMTEQNKRKFYIWWWFFLNKGHHFCYGDTNMTTRPECPAKT